MGGGGGGTGGLMWREGRGEQQWGGRQPRGGWGNSGGVFNL